MKDFIMPDYTRCILNISATLAEYLGVPNRIPTLSAIEKELSKNYKNIVFICFDGLGIEPITRNLPSDNFLRQNIIETLVSTFPSTTTNATTSLLYNKYPLEHGWFGWSMHFEELNQNIDIFKNKDSSTGKPVEIVSSPLGKFDYYFDIANSDYSINTVFPNYVNINHPERNTVIADIDELSNAIKAICRKSGKQFVYSYYGEPDYTMHFRGISGQGVREIFESISNAIEDLYNSVEDTLFIITADHGQIDVEGYVEFYKDEVLMDMLEIYPYMEARAPAFLVKEGMTEKFEEHFKRKYREDFVLYPSHELVEKGFFGEFGDKTHLLGDYIAIGTYTHKQAVFLSDQMRFKGHHTSLTEEMNVPLIMIGKK